MEAERGKQHQTNAKCNGAEARNEAERLVTKESQQNTMQKKQKYTTRFSGFVIRQFG